MDHGWPGVTEIMESKHTDEGAGGSYYVDLLLYLRTWAISKYVSQKYDDAFFKIKHMSFPVVPEKAEKYTSPHWELWLPQESQGWECKSCHYRHVNWTEIFPLVAAQI